MLFKLQQPARKMGGDKYVCTTDENFSIYVPQTISRPTGGAPLAALEITITHINTDTEEV